MKYYLYMINDEEDTAVSMLSCSDIHILQISNYIILLLGFWGFVISYLVLNLHYILFGKINN